jgi:hypothetical protein
LLELSSPNPPSELSLRGAFREIRTIYPQTLANVAQIFFHHAGHGVHGEKISIFSVFSTVSFWLRLLLYVIRG